MKRSPLRQQSTMIGGPDILGMGGMPSTSRGDTKKSPELTATPEGLISINMPSEGLNEPQNEDVLD